MESLAKYLHAFKNLRRANGNAPHKPILLISVLQQYQQHLIDGKQIYMTPELVSAFKTNWNLLVTTPHDCRISYPFYYMKSEGFWSLVLHDGFDPIHRMDSFVKSFSSFNIAVKYAELHDDLFLLMQHTESNLMLQHFLLDYYFHDTKDNLRFSNEQQQQLFDDLGDKILHEPSVAYKAEIERLFLAHNEEEIFLRGSVFKREIPKIYHNTCSISGMRIDAVANVSLVDACHIIPFSLSHDDTISNGIALCPNLHRAFDRGLISIDTQYRVMVSKSFSEIASNYAIKQFEHKLIDLPKVSAYFPTQDNFEWHRIHVFKG